MPNILTETNLILDTCVPRQLEHVQIPDLPISTYADVGEACRDIAGQLTAVGESGVAVLEDICQHFSLHSGHLDRFIENIQTRGVKMGSAYIPGGPLPAWVTTVPEVVGETIEPGWMSRLSHSLSHSLQFLWGYLQSYTKEVVVGAILVVVVVLQLRRNTRKNARTGNDKPPTRGDEIPVSQPAIVPDPSAMGGQLPTTYPLPSINLAWGHLPPTQVCSQPVIVPPSAMGGQGLTTNTVASLNLALPPTQVCSQCQSQKKKRKATDEVSVDPGEAEHVSKKCQTKESRIVILSKPATVTTLTPKPAPRKKRGRPRKHIAAKSDDSSEDKVINKGIDSTVTEFFHENSNASTIWDLQ